MKLTWCILLSVLISCNSSTNDHVSHAVTNKKDTTLIQEDAGNKNDPAIQPVTFNTDELSFKLIPQAVHLQKGIDFNLNIPEGYNLSIAAEGLRRLRFMTKSPDGRLFATDMYNKDDNRKGRVYIFQDWDTANHRFNHVSTYLDSLHNPNQAAFYEKYIYIAETDKLTRYEYHKGDTTTVSKPEVLATFPDYGLGYKYGGWHLTRSLAFHNNKLYVSVGSSCNACLEKEEVRASVIEMDPDGKNKQVYARGLRNSVGIKWIGDQLWATSMGRDLIGPDKPEDLFFAVHKDGYYGWPFYFQFQNKVYADLQFNDSTRPQWVTNPPVAYEGFKAHSAPLGFDYFKGFGDPQLNNSILVALHGSTMVSRQRGNAIVKIQGGNKYTDVISGFLQGKTEKERYGRPCDILMNDDHSFFITDDLNGVLYYIWKQPN